MTKQEIRKALENVGITMTDAEFKRTIKAELAKVLKKEQDFIASMRPTASASANIDGTCIICEVVPTYETETSQEETPQETDENTAIVPVILASSQEETTEPSQNEAPTEILVSFQKLDKRTFELLNANLLVNLSCIKNTDYFKRGLSYFNLRGIKNTLIDSIKKLNEDILETTEPEKEALNAKLKVAENRLTDINQRIANMNLSEIEVVTYNNDMFIQFVSTSTGWTFNIPENVIDPVMDLLRDTEDNVGFSQEIKKALKDALNKVVEIFATKDNEYYSNSRVNFNSTMTELVYRTYADKPKLGKGGVYKETWKNKRIMSKIILDIACAKFQNKIKAYAD